MITLADIQAGPYYIKGRVLPQIYLDRLPAQSYHVGGCEHLISKSAQKMNGNFSTQLPNPPELQPIRSTSSKIWQAASIMLTVGGLGLMAVGGWIFLQQQIEANQPPPARIIEVSVEEIEAGAADMPTPTLLPAPTQAQPGATSQISNGDTLTGQPATAPAEPLVEPPVTEAIAEQPEENPTTEETAPQNNQSATVVESKLVEETTLSQQAEQTAEAEESALSLADNPLPVVEETSDPLAQVAPAEAPPSPITGTGQPLTRIVAESIDLDTGVVEVGWQKVVENGQETNVWVVADYAAGWHQNSKLPGQGGNIVLSAHHNIKGEVFRYTVDLEPGDTVTLYDAEKVYNYVVIDKFIVKDKGEPEAVRRENAKWIGPFNEERLTLVTCWPYTNNTHRLIVIAQPVGEAQAMVE